MTTKKDFLKKFNEAFAQNDRDFILKSMSEDIVWTMVGDKTFEGKQAVEAALEEMNHVETLDMKISEILTSEESAAANGSMKIKDASGKIQSFAFADFYEFKDSNDVMISKMISYILPLKDESK